MALQYSSRFLSLEELGSLSDLIVALLLELELMLELLMLLEELSVRLALLTLLILELLLVLLEDEPIVGRSNGRKYVVAEATGIASIRDTATMLEVAREERVII